MTSRTRERNQALPTTADAGALCRTCSAAASAASDSTPSAGASVGVASGTAPSERRYGVKKCEATNEAGAPCLFTEHAPTIRHLWADSKDRNSLDLGKLQAAVQLYLAGDADREFLATILAETEQGR